jgi:hypothetical protein
MKLSFIVSLISSGKSLISFSLCFSCAFAKKGLIISENFSKNSMNFGSCELNSLLLIVGLIQSKCISPTIHIFEG